MRKGDLKGTCKELHSHAEYSWCFMPFWTWWCLIHVSKWVRDGCLYNFCSEDNCVSGRQPLSVWSASPSPGQFVLNCLLLLKHSDSCYYCGSCFVFIMRLKIKRQLRAISKVHNWAQISTEAEGSLCDCSTKLAQFVNCSCWEVSKPLKALLLGCFSPTELGDFYSTADSS